MFRHSIVCRSHKVLKYDSVRFSEDMIKPEHIALMIRRNAIRWSTLTQELVGNISSIVTVLHRRCNSPYIHFC